MDASIIFQAFATPDGAVLARYLGELDVEGGDPAREGAASAGALVARRQDDGQLA